MLNLIPQYGQFILFSPNFRHPGVYNLRSRLIHSYPFLACLSLLPLRHGQNP